jgi:hypothetical protein
MVENKKTKTSNSQTQNEIEKLGKQFDDFSDQVKDLTVDRMNAAKKEEVEPQTKLSSKEIDKSKDIYLKPERIIADNQKFNEKFREDYNFAKEYVQFIAENKEVIGETIEMWTHPYGGVGAEFWKVPTNKPVWGPRYLAEQIKRRNYHRLSMDESKIVSGDPNTRFYGQIVVDNLIQRLDAIPVSTRKSIFMGASSF